MKIIKLNEKKYIIDKEFLFIYSLIISFLSNLFLILILTFVGAL